MQEFILKKNRLLDTRVAYAYVNIITTLTQRVKILDLGGLVLKYASPFQENTQESTQMLRKFSWVHLAMF